MLIWKPRSTKTFILGNKVWGIKLIFLWQGKEFSGGNADLPEAAAEGHREDETEHRLTEIVSSQALYAEIPTPKLIVLRGRSFGGD